MTDDVALADRAAYLPAADALVLADLHLGRDDASNVAFPLGERQRLPDRIAALLERFEPATVAVAGDVLHAFDSVPDGASETFERIGETVAATDAELVLVAGNHDSMLAELAGADPPTEYRLADGTVVCHGDELPESSADRYVIGHDHPAIVVEGDRRPCYLRGPAAHDDAEVLVLPAFNGLTRGSVVNGARGHALDTPLIDDVDAFRPAVRDPDAAETLWFPPLGQFRELL